MASNAEENRPSTARRDSRKVPGGFTHDDEDDLSPTKRFFDESSWINANAEAHSSNDQIPTLDATKLPQLTPEDSSLMSAQTQENSEGHMDTLDEKAMRKHLMDVESSFVPAPSPIGIPTNPGVDDTFLFDGAAAAKPAHSPVGKTPNRLPTVEDAESDDSAFSPPAITTTYHTPALPQNGFENSTSENSILDNGGNTTSSLETMSSSPTAAAAARTVSRAVSMASMGGYETAEDTSESHEESEKDDNELTPKKNRRRELTHGDSSDERSTIRNQDSRSSLNSFAADAGHTPGAGLLHRRSEGRRPKFLRSRNASQRSSVSSFTTNTDSHDENGGLGTDYALQSGGALPADGQSRSSSYMLSRSISLGSMASGIEDSSEGRYPDRALATLDEEERNRGRKGTGSGKDDDTSPPLTPRATSQSLAAPTDTVIAQHVRNVQVPESLAREYRTKSGISTPGRLTTVGLSVPSIGRNGKNMTLKEQSSTIERLSKENFDLKLKVMFLSDRLDKLSEEGVKEMISENVDLKTTLANVQRDNKSLRRKVRELEQKLKNEEDRPQTATSGGASDDARSPGSFDQDAQEREEELIYLRERVEEYTTEIEKLRGESLNREAERRKLAEVVRTMSEKRSENLEAREEMDVWKDLLEQETARREEADEENRKLRDEIFRLKSEATAPGSVPGLNHTTKIYLTQKRQGSPTRPRSRMSEQPDDNRTGTISVASTLVDELRKESEQLRHENAELRREVGAQTSMLTSRNREKERLYQEIEDLKLRERRGGGSIAGDSIFERSASRAGGTHERSLSRNSGNTKQTETGLSDSEREELENKNAELRDNINALKLQNQELQQELQACMDDFELAVLQKKEAETLAGELQEELEAAEGDLQTLQAERDEALRGQEGVEIEFESLRKEAQEEIDALESEAEQKDAEFQQLQAELSDRTENFNALQTEMRELSEALVRLEDDQDAKLRRIQELEQELEDANRELEEMEKGLVEANNKVNRLTVQQESSQGEIAFLREEQDGDKIKIGDLEAAIRSAEENLRDEKERVKDLEQTLVNERLQREFIAGKEKQEVQKFINELNREATGAKDEARKLRKSLTSREVEAAEWKERLMELENNLREALGDLNGTRSSLLKSIEKLQRELENTTRELETTKAAVAEKDRLIQQRDSLLESHGLESRRLADMLDKERQSHRNTRHQHETFLKSHTHTARTASQQETRIIELEQARQQDRKKLTALENSLKDQITERNNLLLNLWDRLSAICGSDWAHDNSLINGRALPSPESLSTMLPGFSKNLMAAVKTIESIIGGFKTKIKSVERDLWKEYQNLEHNLDLRTKKLDRLETVVKSGVISGPGESKAEINRLKEINRSLKTELSTLRTTTSKHAASGRISPPDAIGSPAPSVPHGPRDKERSNTLTRHHSTSTVETIERATTSAGIRPPGTSSGSDEANEERWIFRLRELERRLKAEREARLLDRSGARKRLEEGERRNEELKAELEREKLRKDTALH